jgi:hypothetical protein
VSRGDGQQHPKIAYSAQGDAAVSGGWIKTEQRVSESGDKMGSRKRLNGAIQIGKQWQQRST